MQNKVAEMLLDGVVVTKDARFKPFVENVVTDLNSQLARVREQWVDGKITDEVAHGRASVLKNRARDKIAKRIPMRRGAPMVNNV